MRFETSLFWAVILFTATAALIDCFQRRIPNWLTASCLLLSLSFYGLMHGAPGLRFAATGFAAGFGVLFVLWAVGGGGAGDVKLMGALGAMLGAKLTLAVFFLSTALAGAGVLACGAWDLTRRRQNAAASQPKERRLVPFALPVAVGAWMVLAWQAALDPPQPAAGQMSAAAAAHTAAHETNAH